MAVLFAHVADAKPSGRLKLLAQEVTDKSGVDTAYAISVVPEELLTEEGVPDATREFALKWAYEGAFVVVATDAMSATVECSLGGLRIGRAALNVDFAGDHISLGLEWVDQVDGQAGLQSECKRILTDTETVKIYYESGHTVAQGRCYSSQYTDAQFEWDFKPFGGYTVTREKPVLQGSSLAQRIGVDGDTSLFAYTLEKLFTDANGNPVGWLACDDGSMELADFIHLDPVEKRVTLVHAKASGSADAARLASVADYEIVVSQAIKNLRHLERRNLFDELDKGKGKKIGAAVWKDGVKQADRAEFLRAVKALPSRYAKVALVLQPRLTKTERDACQKIIKPNARSLRMKQLDALMLSARLSAMACGADFVGIADEA